MDTLLRNFRAQCLEAVLNLLWRQWCSLGVAGHSEPANPALLIDPEALLLATTSLGRHDPRLFDEAVDWLGAYGSLINLQRVKNLQQNTILGDEPVLQAIAEWVGTHKTQPRWKSLLPKSKPSDPVTQLFITGNDLTPREADAIFLAYGLERPRFETRGMSQAPNPTLPPNLVFTLRALIGVSARVEVILYLVGHKAAYASEIARITGYAPRTLQALMQEMTLSGRVVTQETSANNSKVRKGANRLYQIEATDWAFLTSGKAAAQWFPWGSLYAFVRDVLVAIPNPSDATKHPAIISSKIRASLVTHGPTLFGTGILGSLHLRPDASGEDLLQSIAAHLPDIIGGL